MHDRLQRRHRWRRALTLALAWNGRRRITELAGYNLLLAVLATAWGAWPVAAAALVAASVQLVASYRVDRLPTAWLRALASTLASYGPGLAIAASLPPAAESLAVVYPTGLLTFVVARTWWRPLAFFLLYVGLAVAVLGSWAPALDPVAARGFGMTIVYATLVYGLVVSVVGIDQAREGIFAGLERLTHGEELKREESAALESVRAALASNNDRQQAERDRLGRSLARQQAATEELTRRRDEEGAMMEAIHQDLSEPLRNMISFAQLARRRLVAEGGADALTDYFDYIADGGQRMARMLTDLQAYARGEGGEDEGEVDLAELYEDVRRDLGAGIIARRAVVRAEGLPVVRGARTQLAQLFQNLIANALKFVGEGVVPRITVRGELLADGRLAVAFSDNGIGIPPERLSQVFGLFNRAHAEQGFAGSGVGLALCRKIAIAHGGTLEVASAPGRGTTFTLTLPRDRRVGLAAVRDTSAAGEAFPQHATPV